MLACSRHWYQVPKPIRAAVYRAWRGGQGAGTEAHANAMRAAIRTMRPLDPKGGLPAVESMQTRQARDRRNVDQGAMRQHDLTCITCRQAASRKPRGPRCAAGRELAEALAESSTNLRREVDRDRAPHPDQQELFG
jgi:hypothetical protein